MFKQAVLRLTLWYLLLVMLLSASFSVALYRVSANELNANQFRVQGLVRRSYFIGMMPPGTRDFNQELLDQADASRQNIIWNLVYFNLAILLAGGGLSYFLAKRTLQPLEESMEAQQRFTSDASHELRTPLTAMRSEIEVALRDKGLDLGQSKELLQSNLEEVDRLEALANSLLKLSNSESDKQAAYESVQLEEVVEEVVKRQATAAKKRKVKLVTEVEQREVLIDRWSFMELLSILLDNAVKFSPDDSEVKVVVSLVQSGGQLHCSVIDQGSGIAETDLPHIFERFYRAEHSRNQEVTSGYGLGLSIAKKIVEAARGNLVVDSEVGRGSTFTVTLPVKAV